MCAEISFSGFLSDLTNTIKMISDIQLAMFANLLGIVLFLLVVLYHFIQVSSGENHSCQIAKLSGQLLGHNNMSNFNVWGYLAR